MDQQPTIPEYEKLYLKKRTLKDLQKVFPSLKFNSLNQYHQAKGTKLERGLVYKMLFFLQFNGYQNIDIDVESKELIIKGSSLVSKKKKTLLFINSNQEYEFNHSLDIGNKLGTLSKKMLAMRNFGSKDIHSPANKEEYWIAFNLVNACFPAYLSQYQNESLGYEISDTLWKKINYQTEENVCYIFEGIHDLFLGDFSHIELFESKDSVFSTKNFALKGILKVGETGFFLPFVMMIDFFKDPRFVLRFRYLRDTGEPWGDMTEFIKLGQNFVFLDLVKSVQECVQILNDEENIWLKKQIVQLNYINTERNEYSEYGHQRGLNLVSEELKEWKKSMTKMRQLKESKAEKSFCPFIGFDRESKLFTWEIPLDFREFSTGIKNFTPSFTKDKIYYSVPLRMNYTVFGVFMASITARSLDLLPKKMLLSCQEYKKKGVNQWKFYCSERLSETINEFPYVMVSFFKKEIVVRELKRHDKRFKTQKKQGKFNPFDKRKMYLKKREISLQKQERSRKKLKNLQLEIKENIHDYDLRKILARIPGFKFEFSKEQQKIINWAGGVKSTLIIGRSGTGKTTCCILRMIAIDLLFIAKKAITIDKKEKVSVEDIQPTGIKHVFITASRVLADDLRVLYENMIKALKGKLSQIKGKKGAKIETIVKIIDKLKETEEKIKNSAEEMSGDESEFEVLTEEILNFGSEDEETAVEDKDIINMTNLKKKKTLEEIERRLDEYDFRNHGQQNKSSKIQYPLFTTLIDFYQRIDFASSSSVLKSYQFKLTEEKKKSIKKVGFNEYLDHYSNRKFYEWSENMNKKIAHTQSYKDYHKKEKDEYFSRLITVQIFEDEFMPYLKEHYQIILKERRKFSIHEEQLFIKQYIKGGKGMLDDRDKYKSFPVFKTIFSEAMYWSLLKNRTHLHKEYLKHSEAVDGFKFLIAVFEDWKRLNNSYELTDLIHYYEHQKQFDFVYLDEVQDVPLNITVDLSIKAKFGFVGFGDNAQNITQGISIKFQELLDNVSLEENSAADKSCQLIQLRKNYRSQKKILKMGNTVVGMLEYLQRGDMDMMADEISEVDCPKPILIKYGEKLEVFLKTCIKKFGMKMINGRLQCGAEQVLLVPNEVSKKNLPDVLKNLICFTIKESKGLEFRDVILFNFFRDGEFDSCSKSLKRVAIRELEITKAKWEMFNNKRKLSLNNSVDGQRVFNHTYNADKEVYNVFVMTKNSMGSNKETEETYNALNDQLKSLYVAITRTKERFMIFDEPGKMSFFRKRIDEYWLRLDVMNVISNIDDVEDDKELEQISVINQEKITLEWISKGFEFFRREQFQHAKICFNNLQNQRMIDLCDACIKLRSIQKKEYYITVNQDLNKVESDRLEAEIPKDYLEVAKLFEKSGKIKDASLCYFNGYQIEKAQTLFLEMGMDKEIAQVYYIQGKFKLAAKYFAKIKEYFSCLMCSNLAGDLKLSLDIFQLIAIKDKEFLKSEKNRELLKQTSKKYLTQLSEELLQATDRGYQADINPTQSYGTSSIVSQSEFTDLGKEEESDYESFKVLQESVHMQSQGSITRSFIRVGLDPNSVNSDQQSTGFVNIGLSRRDCPNFIENKILADITKVASFFFANISDYVKNSQFAPNRDKIATEKEEPKDDFDFEMMFDEYDPKLINLLLFALEDWGLHDLRFFIINRYKLKDRMMDALMNYSEQYSFITRNKVYFNYVQFYKCFKLGTNKAGNRMTGYIFSWIFNKIDSNLLKLDSESSLLTIDHVQTLVALGYIYQIPIFLNYEQNKKLLAFLGEFDSLASLYLDQKCDKPGDRLALLTKYQKQNYFERIETICAEHYDESLLNAGLYRMFINSFWDYFSSDKISIPKKFCKNKAVKKRLPYFSKVVGLLCEFQNLESIQEKRAFGVKVGEILENSLEKLLSPSFKTGSFKEYELGIAIGVIFAVFKTNNLPNSPFVVLKKEKLPTFFKKTIGQKQRMFLKGNLKFKQILETIDDMMVNRLSQNVHTELKKGFYSVFLVRIADPSASDSLFRAFGYGKKYILHKMSNKVRLIKHFHHKLALNMVSNKIKLLDNSLEYLRMEESDFGMMLLLEKKKSGTNSKKLINQNLISVKENEFMSRTRKHQTSQSKLLALRRQRFQIKNKLNTDAAKRFKLLTELIQKHKKNSAKKPEVQKWEKERADFVKNNKDHLREREFYELVTQCSNFLVKKKVGKGILLKEFLFELLNFQEYTPKHVLQTFLLCKKLDMMHLFHYYYREYKKFGRTTYPNSEDLIFCLLDSQMSLLAGCSNEFISNILFVLNSYRKSFNSLVILNLISEVVLVYLISSGNTNLILNSQFLKYFSGEDKAGYHNQDHNSIIDNQFDKIRTEEQPEIKIANTIQTLFNETKNIDFKFSLMSLLGQMKLNIKTKDVHRIFDKLQHVIGKEKKYQVQITRTSIFRESSQHEQKLTKVKIIKPGRAEDNLKDYSKEIANIIQKRAQYHHSMNTFRKHKTNFFSLNSKSSFKSSYKTSSTFLGEYKCKFSISNQFKWPFSILHKKKFILFKEKNGGAIFHLLIQNLESELKRTISIILEILLNRRNFGIGECIMSHLTLMRTIENTLHRLCDNGESDGVESSQQINYLLNICRCVQGIVTEKMRKAEEIRSFNPQNSKYQKKSEESGLISWQIKTQASIVQSLAKTYNKSKILMKNVRRKVRMKEEKDTADCGKTLRDLNGSVLNLEADLMKKKHTGKRSIKIRQGMELI